MSAPAHRDDLKSGGSSSSQSFLSSPLPRARPRPYSRFLKGHFCPHEEPNDALRSGHAPRGSIPAAQHARPGRSCFGYWLPGYSIKLCLLFTTKRIALLTPAAYAKLKTQNPKLKTLPLAHTQNPKLKTQNPKLPPSLPCSLTSAIERNSK